MKANIFIAGSGGIGQAAGLILSESNVMESTIYFGDISQTILDHAEDFVVKARPTHVPNDRRSGAILFFACVGFAVMSRLFGSLVLLPTALFAAAVVYAQNYFRPIFSTASFVFGAAVMIGPTVLEHFGLLAPSYTFDAEGMRIAPNVVSFPKGPTIVLLLVANVFVIASVWRLTRRIQRALADAEGRVAVHGWHLRLMVPEEARHAVRTPTVRGRGAKPSVGNVPASHKVEPEKAPDRTT